MGDEHDAVIAELEYLRARELELKQEVAQHAQDLGVPVTAETVEQLLAGVVGALQQSGNGNAG
jgi:hypothetical protein